MVVVDVEPHESKHFMMASLSNLKLRKEREDRMCSESPLMAPGWLRTWPLRPLAPYKLKTASAGKGEKKERKKKCQCLLNESRTPQNHRLSTVSK